MIVDRRTGDSDIIWGRKMKRKREISTFKRLLFIFTAVMLPVILVGFSTIWFLGKKNEQDALKLVHTQMEYHIEKFEGSFQEIRDREIALLSNKELRQLASLPEMYTEYERSRAILRVQSELNAIRSYQNYISDVCVILPKLQRVIHAEGYDRGSYVQLDAELMGELEEMPVTGAYGIGVHQGDMVMPLIAHGANGVPMYAVLIRFSGRAMEEELSYSANVPGSLFQFEIPALEFFLSDMPGEQGAHLEAFMREEQEEKETFRYRWNHMKWYVFREPVTDMGGIWCNVIPIENIVPETRNLILLSALFFGATIVCIGIFFRSAHRLVNEPMQNLAAAFQRVERGDFAVRLDGMEEKDFGYMYQAFNKMTENLQSSIDKIYNQTLLIQKMELKQLQAQINPHFLYNSYFLLHRLIKKEDYEKAVLFSKEMGTYFRFITRSGREVVDLEEENGHAEIYAQLQAIRFEGRIRIEYENLPKEYKRIQVPRLIVQPILENAFGHGLEDKEADGLLRVTFHPGEKEGDFCIRVEDNGESLSGEELTALEEKFEREPGRQDGQEVTGLVNINRRLKIFYGGEYGLYLSRSELGGLCVEIRIRGGEKDGKAVSPADRG